MSKERPNPDKIANELAAGSAFFRSAPKSTAAPTPIQPAQHLPNPAPASEAPPVRPVRPARPAKRQMIRHPFELYMDQLDRLRERAEEQRRAGEPGSMSRMVREAIDRYLDEQSASNQE